MARLEIEDDQLVVGLSPAEALLALHRVVRVPLAAVRSVVLEPHPWRAARGIRVGTSVPGVMFYGTRRHAGGKDFGAHRGRAPVVRVDLDEPSPYARLLISVADAPGAVASIKAAAGV